jgi:hypothetical protein
MSALVPGLVATLTIGLTVVSALGVFNTVVLNTRDRTRDFAEAGGVTLPDAYIQVYEPLSLVILASAGIAIGDPRRSDPGKLGIQVEDRDGAAQRMRYQEISHGRCRGVVRYRSADPSHIVDGDEVAGIVDPVRDNAAAPEECLPFLRSIGREGSERVVGVVHQLAQGGDQSVERRFGEALELAESLSRQLGPVGHGRRSAMTSSSVT